MDFNKFLKIFDYFAKRENIQDGNYTCYANSSEISEVVVLHRPGVVSFISLIVYLA